MEKFREHDFRGAEFRDCDFAGARFVGVEMADVEIDGDIERLTVLGVDVMPYVESELDRTYPERVLIRSEDPAELREGWRQLQASWAPTVDRIVALPPELQRRQVNEEWSAVQTLRHLVMANDAWFRRAVLGEAEPFWPGGLSWTTDYPPSKVGLDPDADPSLEEVLAVRAARVAELTSYLETADADALAAPATGAVGPGWPTEDMDLQVGRCLRVVMNETFWHHRFCVRDLDLLPTAG